MSFEGYYQVVCSKGHLGGLPVLYDSAEEEREQREYKCDGLIDGQQCNAGLAEINLVDDTNCNAYGEKKFIVAQDKVVKECNLGHTHIWSSEIGKLSKERYYSEGGSQIKIEKRPNLTDWCRLHKITPEELVCLFPTGTRAKYGTVIKTRVWSWAWIGTWTGTETGTRTGTRIWNGIWTGIKTRTGTRAWTGARTRTWTGARTRTWT